MLNQVILVGRIVRDPEMKLPADNRDTVIVLAIPNSYKNSNGEYDTNFIKCVLYNGIAKNVIEYCHKGDLVGVRGRIVATNEENMMIVANRITFLTQSSK